MPLGKSCFAAGTTSRLIQHGEVLRWISNLNFLFDRFLRSASKQVEDKAGGTSLTPKLRRYITPRRVYDEKGNALVTLERLRKTHSQRRHVDFVERGDSILLSERDGCGGGARGGG